MQSSRRRASEKRQRQFNKVAPSRNKFKALCMNYLDAEREIYLNVELAETWCHILRWLSDTIVKCTHIVPFCSDFKEHSYILGNDDSALRPCRNGLLLNNVIEGGWDHGWVAIVPDRMNSFVNISDLDHAFMKTRKFHGLRIEPILQEHSPFARLIWTSFLLVDLF